MRLRIGVVLVVVGLALVRVGPVLAQSVTTWEWHTGDSCVWSPSERCQWNGILLPMRSEISGNPGAATQTTRMVNATSQTLNVTTGPMQCVRSQAYIDIMEGGNVIYSFSLSQLPQLNISTTVNQYIYLRNMNYMETCLVTDITLVGELIPDPTPMPEPSIISDFSPASLLSIAGELVTYLGGLIAIVAGVLLGFRLLGLFIRWLRGR